MIGDKSKDSHEFEKVRASVLSEERRSGRSRTFTGSGCAPRPYVIEPAPRRRFAPVLVSPERVIRTIAGLRPYRPSGFVLGAERIGDKLLVHDYGHGGGGVTLSWVRLDWPLTS